MLRRKRKSKTKAPATVMFTSARNEQGEKQLCVYAECHFSGRRFGPTWSHTEAAVRRCLATLTQNCDCGRKFHSAREYVGKRITGLDHPKKP